MAAKRILLGAFLAGVVGTSAAPGQTDPGGGAAPPTLSGVPPAAPSAAGTGFQPYLPPGSTGTGSTAVLTAPPGRPLGLANTGGTGGLGQGSYLPPGSVAGPWCGGQPAGCCGPVGANGPVAYELYFRTGPNLIVGGGPELSGALKNGWTVGGGGRSLLFNVPGTAAWVIDLGLSYTYDRGDRGPGARVFDVFTAQPQNTSGQLQGPDLLAPVRVRALHRSSFNFALGRDWFLNGPGTTGCDAGWNSRVGVDVGGRWGSAHVDLVPAADLGGYQRKQNVFESTVVGAHWDWECPFGGTILFGGVRAEWGYTWTNIVAPQDGNIQDVNLLLTAGVRF